MLKKILCMMAGIMFSASLFSLSARLVTIDFEYDLENDQSYVLGTYNFVWETESGSMTGFYYIFDRDVEIDYLNSFAIVNKAGKAALSIEKIGPKYDICLEGKNRFSGRCEYTVFARFPKNENAKYSLDSGIFDSTIDNTIMTMIYAIQADQTIIADIETNGIYANITVNKNGIDKKALRVEKDGLVKGQELYLAFSIKNSEDDKESSESLLDMIPRIQYDSRLFSAHEYEKISKLIMHFDLALEQLPDSVIEEFANSDMFEIYKSVCKDYGLLGKDQSSLSLSSDGNYMIPGDKVSDLYSVLCLFRMYIDELPDASKEKVKESEEYVLLLQMLGVI